jgi:hypothetical protein
MKVWQDPYGTGFWLSAFSVGERRRMRSWRQNGKENR